jgi:ABC-type branched-subunit amino acid transport system substrate-binding protein
MTRLVKESPVHLLPPATSKAARAGALLAGAALLLTACSSGSTSPSASKSSVPQSTSSAKGTPILIGNIVDLTGPVTGLFKAARQAMDAYVAMVNAQGGIGGRPLQLVTADSKIDCNATRAAYEELAPKVEAFVGNVSAIDGCAADVLPKWPKLPAVFQQLDPSLANIATVLTAAPSPGGQSVGGLKWIAAKNPGALDHVAVLVNKRVAFAGHEMKAGLEAIGAKVVFTREIQSEVQTDYTADVIKMKSAGVQWVSADSFQLEAVARLLDAAKQQNWHPKVITAATAYDGNLFSVADPAAAEGVYLPQAFALFLGEDRKTSKGVDAYLTWLEKVHPGAKPDLFGAYAWANAMLYTQAREAAGGASATPEQVVKALIATKKFDADGLLAESNPGDQKPATCFLVAQIKGGKFVRQFPSSGFSCEGAQYVPYTGS